MLTLTRSRQLSQTSRITRQRQFTRNKPCCRPGLKCAASGVGTPTDLAAAQPKELLRELVSIGDDTCHRVNRVHLGLLDAIEAKRALPVLLTLTRQCQLTSREWQKILIRHPSLLSYSQDDVEDVLNFLRNDLGLNQEQLTSVVTRFPQVFSFGVKAHLRPQLAYLESLGIQHQQLPAYVTERPLLLGEGIDTVVKFLTACRVPRKQLASLLRTYPIDYCCRFIYPSNIGSEADEGEDA